MRRRGKLIGVAVVLAGALIVGTVAAPAAEREEVKTNVKFGPLAPRLAAGHIVSKERACENERSVYLFWWGGVGQPSRVAIGKTNEKGHFNFHKDLASGTYYVIAHNQRKDGFDCSWDASGRLSLP